MFLFSRRSLLSAAATVGGLALARRGMAQVGSGGTGISPAASIGTADLVTGAVTLYRDGQPPVPLESGASLQQGDQVETGAGAEVHLAFGDGGYLALRADSNLKINRYVVTGEATDIAAMTLVRGALRSVTGWIGKLDPQRYRIFAGAATISVRGTDHEVVLVQPQGGLPDAEPGVHDRVNEGATVLRSAGSAVDVAQGAAGYAPRGAAPRLNASVPAFFDRLRTPQDARVETQAREAQRRIEGRLRQLGRLGAGERFEQYRERLQARRRGRAAPVANPLPLSREQRRAAREQRRRARAGKQPPPAQR
ncbi:FecR domain-containing protein [Caenimonas terrae]|uniref:FecR domain-containing protein n=1 Tax=Caenimonas terrae TaxID=696074 RepID=A0ABW0NA99_9BURK